MSWKEKLEQRAFDRDLARAKKIFRRVAEKSDKRRMPKKERRSMMKTIIRAAGFRRIRIREKIGLLALIVLLLATSCGEPGRKSEAQVPISEWYRLPLGERIEITGGCGQTLMRVPGGWIVYPTLGYSTAAVFIPYSEEGLPR